MTNGEIEQKVTVGWGQCGQKEVVQGLFTPKLSSMTDSRREGKKKDGFLGVNKVITEQRS